jgi:2-polyprenyl-6-methoxyphenol hydroxylase-like FAD-dependent oxidoreductase
MTEHAMVIGGGGPTGLMLAGELALADVDVAIVERRESQDLDGLRAGGLHIRTIEVLDQRGIADRFVSQGQTIRCVPFAGTTLDTSDLLTRHNYFLALWQTRTERILADWVGELDVPIYRGREVTGFTQNDVGVDIELSDDRSMRAEYLIGCDGGRSLIRKRAGIDFPGWDPSTSYLIAELETAQEPKWGMHRSEKGISAVAKLDDGKRARVVLTEQHVGQGGKPTLHDVHEALVAVYGTDYGLRTATYISRFTDMARQASLLSSGTRAPGRRRGARAFPKRWTGTQCRYPGCSKSGLEASPGGPWDIARRAPGYVPCRAASSRRPRVAQHQGAHRARPQ